MRTVFIIDIDTTIADAEHRAALLERECLVCLAKVAKKGEACPNCNSSESKISQGSWDSFLDPVALAKDNPVLKAQQAIRRMAELGMEFHYITGRNTHLRTVTESWLQFFMAYDPAKNSLIMRGEEHKNTPASSYKAQALQQLIRERGLVDTSFVFFEDDDHVFGVYQQFGIVIRCPEGWEHWMPTPAEDPEPLWKT